MTGRAILTPMLMALIMIIGDFLGMALTTDNVRPSPHPNSWGIGRLTIAGFVMGLGQLAFCVAVLAVGDFVAGYDIATLRTLAFVTLVCGNQATTYNNRERRRIWSSRPSSWLIASSVVDTLIACVLAVTGIAMASPIPRGGRGRARRRCRFRPSDGPCESPAVSQTFPHLNERGIGFNVFVDAIIDCAREPLRQAPTATSWRR